MNDSILILLAAFLLDLIFGDPVYRFHPVRLIGNWINYLENIFFKFKLTGIISGVIFWFCIVTVPLMVYIFFYALFDNLKLHALLLSWQIFIVYSSFAFRDMVAHARPIYKNLKEDNLALARNNLKFIVGRDVDELNSEGIVRAAVESISESFVDGFLAPIFWYVFCTVEGLLYSPEYLFFFGPAGVFIYRIANTLDSMIGYQSDTYEKFGKFSARVDDLLNFIPARLSLLFLLPGVFLSGGNVLQSVRIFLRDRLKSKSPNAAHSISIFAGALNVSLGGPALYGGYMLDKPVLGDSKKELTKEDLNSAIKIFIYSGIFAIIISTWLLLQFKLT